MTYWLGIMAKKIRLDELVVQQNLAEDIEKAKRLIMAGEIRSGDHVWDKAGQKVPAETILELKNKVCPYVSRGGLKLERALTRFQIDPTDMECLDIGASTGGFTHVLLLKQAKRIVALDVGYGLLDDKVRTDPRVEVHDRTNFRLIADDYFGRKFDLIVTDVSFISLLSIIPKASRMLVNKGNIIALIKPQFEARKDQVPDGGVIKDPQVHFQVVDRLQSELEQQGVFLHKIEPVPLISRKKNIEFVSLWTNEPYLMAKDELKEIINLAHSR